ncbi:hypothetical protein FQA39_LY14958 [Lamprigera yunnana]|nr:hypothetical protein FQA39_LY14958 [Lamprigera yunnana]
MESHPIISKQIEDCNVESEIDYDCNAIVSKRELDFIVKQSIDYVTDIKENIKTEHSDEKNKSSEKCELERDKTKYLRKNKFLWTVETNTLKRETLRHNVIIARPALLGPTNLRIITPEEMWYSLTVKNILLKFCVGLIYELKK